MKVRINIDTLVLEGFNPADHTAISRELAQELEQLIVKNGLQGIETPDLPAINAGAFNISPDQGFRSIGTKVAHSIYRSLNPKNGSI